LDRKLVIEDGTARREQKLLQAKLLGMFSHDLQGPISSILLTSSLLRTLGDQVDRASQVEHLNRIEAAAQLLQQMREDIWTVAQMEANLLKYNPQWVDIEPLLCNLVNILKVVYGESRRVELLSDCVDGVNLDHHLFRQIAVNLISNAMKYSGPTAAIKIVATVEQDKFCFSVCDHGIGIPAEEQTLLFQPFHRCSNVGDVSGTGLGLAIVKHAVELCGGAIEIESTVAQGTTITIHLPLASD
jgi:K+-sensing histidine kinase KdpD